jgi:O-acetyl-ADP-ribose deacetylase (regulator of RNase III)
MNSGKIQPSMKWTIEAGDVLCIPADVLICSANVFLNLSGGVGGEILLRFGAGMQEELHEWLRRVGKRHVERGDVVVTNPHGTHFQAVVHAVAVDGFYQSSPAVIEAVTGKALQVAAELQARRVALTALATGFGRLSMSDFAKGIKPLLKREFGAVEEVVLCVRSQEQRHELTSSLGKNVPDVHPAT